MIGYDLLSCACIINILNKKEFTFLLKGVVYLLTLIDAFNALNTDTSVKYVKFLDVIRLGPWGPRATGLERLQSLIVFKTY